MTSDQESVAIYWDFENIHASLVDQRKGAGTYRQSRFTPQDPFVDVEAMMEFAASLGSVAINRAYGNWQWFARYREVLLRNAVELIQLFPPGASAKNGADIKLCLDAMEDIIRFPHLSTIMIVGGDSDFLPVAQKIKATGKTLVGVGCEASTNKHWAHSCHEFRYYEKLILDDSPPGDASADTLAAPAVPPAVAPDVTPAAAASPGPVVEPANEQLSTPPSAVDLIRRAIARLSANKGDPWVVKASIRPMVKRLDPTFDEKNYGQTMFAELLKQHADVFEVRKGQYDHEYRIKRDGQS